MRRLLATLTILVASCTATPTPSTTPPDPDLVAVGRDICPLMWQWQLAVGKAMNEMSYLAFREPDPAKRQSLYLEAFSTITALNRELRERVTSLAEGPYSDLLAEEILNGLAESDAILIELSDSIGPADDGTEVEPPSYHEIMPRVFLTVEKAIDVPKPELATYHDPELIRAFMSVPQCQHGVKDANDGVPRYVPPF